MKVSRTLLGVMWMVAASLILLLSSSLLQPIRGEDSGHVTSCGPITAHLLFSPTSRKQTSPSTAGTGSSNLASPATSAANSSASFTCTTKNI